MSISTLSTLPSSTRDDGSMSSSHPRADGPCRRRFMPEQKLADSGRLRGGLRAAARRCLPAPRGPQSPLITEWRRLRDAGVLQGKQPGQAIGRPSKEQAEIARLRRELEDDPVAPGSHRDRAGDHGKARACSWRTSPRARIPRPSATTLTNAYTDLTVQGTPTRAASVSTGISRATASRRQQRPGPPVPRGGGAGQPALAHRTGEGDLRC